MTDNSKKLELYRKMLKDNRGCRESVKNAMNDPRVTADLRPLLRNITSTIYWCLREIAKYEQETNSSQ